LDCFRFFILSFLDNQQRHFLTPIHPTPHPSAMKISTFLSCSALFLASLAAAAAPNDPSKIDTCTKPGVVAWTIDDGPGMFNDQLLAIMAKKNVTATFFVL
jgi:peptidoglycan/xylan/chitin deacetylase (PgdA/CDA1 family)